MSESTAPVRATPTQIRQYFQDGGPKVTMQELKELKEDPASYDQIAHGIADGTLTY